MSNGGATMPKTPLASLAYSPRYECFRNEIAALARRKVDVSAWKGGPTGLCWSA